MRVWLAEILSVSIIAVACGCQAMSYADRGATLGALTGALSGAAIGEHNGDAVNGALVGSVVGGLAGAAVGDTIDYEAARSAEIIEQRMGRKIAGAVAIQDVIAMSQAGLSENVITTHLRVNGVSHPPSVNDLITLRNAGVSDTVLEAVQQASPPAPQVSSQYDAAGPPAAVIIEEHHYAAPPFPFHRHPHHRHHSLSRPGVHWGISFGH